MSPHPQGAVPDMHPSHLGQRIPRGLGMRGEESTCVEVTHTPASGRRQGADGTMTGGAVNGMYVLG